MANDIMIDLETLDTSPYCVILTIGAVRFDPKGNGVAERLELRPTIEEQIETHKRIIDDNTIDWWAKQNPAALEEAMGDKGRISFNEAMEILYKFCWNRRAVWSNGVSGTTALYNLNSGVYTATITDYYGDYVVTNSCSIIAPTPRATN